LRQTFSGLNDLKTLDPGRAKQVKEKESFRASGGRGGGMSYFVVEGKRVNN